MSQSETFLTGTDSQVLKKESSVLLEPIRVEHKKIVDVVDSFRGKVSSLIDKQRNEYIVAYENHMQDVQKELHNLREKVAEIANDETKAEKTKELKEKQAKFRAEAFKLEADSDEMRKRMAIHVRKIYTVG